MKNKDSKTASLVAVLAAAIACHPALAADPIQVQWNQVCHAAGGREVTVTTASGEIVQGDCFAVDVNQIAVKTKDKGIVKVARKSLSRIDVYRAKDHQLRALANNVRKGLNFGWDSMLSPIAPVGIVAIPATLAWGAVSAPFCVLGDLRAKIAGKRQIKPL